MHILAQERRGKGKGKGKGIVLPRIVHESSEGE